MKNTMIEMVAELEKLSNNPYIEVLKNKAKAGEFHDYRSPHACGKMYAVQCIDHVLKSDVHTTEDALGLQKINRAIIDGEYDEVLTDEDRSILKEECLNDKTMSEENRKFFFAGMGIK